MLSSILYPLSSIFNLASSKKRALAFLALCALILLASCGPNMRDQAKCQPLEASSFFADGKCARDLPPDTVSRGSLQGDEAQAAGDVAQAKEFPFPITREVLSAGHLSYDTFCSPCHGLAGYGDGMIVQRGFPAPPSFHQQRLRDVPPGYIYSVITNGFGRMFSYASRVEPDERWAIVAYIRALQLSQNATIDDVPPDERSKLQGASQ